MGKFDESGMEDQLRALLELGTVRYLVRRQPFSEIAQVLIGTLAQSKITANNIERRMKEAAKMQEIIASTRTGYMPVASRASQLFFCISDLATVDPMYQVSFTPKNKPHTCGKRCIRVYMVSGCPARVPRACG